MSRVLITAFEPYGDFDANASWLTLVELTKGLPDAPQITTRLYPVEFAAARKKVSEDLAGDFDFAVHLGQNPGSSSIELEHFALNTGSDGKSEHKRLERDGPDAYQTQLPLGGWQAAIKAEGVPARLSFHAGTYLCNAVYFWSQFFAARHQVATRSVFIHVPLDPGQTLNRKVAAPHLPATMSAQAIRAVLKEIVEFKLA